MRKIFTVFVTSSIFLAMFGIVFAQGTTPLAPSATPSPVEYTLPYPGILPDHPLYFFKRLRDQILLTFISSPVRKVEFYILLADKHLQMAILLLNKNKPELALTTVQKSVDYLTSAEKLVLTVSAAGNPEISNNKNRLEKSLLKHREEIQKLSTRLAETDKVKLAEITQQLEQLYQEYLRSK